jgi:hypothetical protein
MRLVLIINMGGSSMKRDSVIRALATLLLSLLSVSAIAQINFTEHTIDSNIHGTGGIYACDVNGDSLTDVLAASLEDNQILYWQNHGNNPITWSKHVIGSNVASAHSVYAADFDGNSTIDVAGAAYYGSPGIAWWQNNGEDPISWTKFTVSSNFINAHEVFAFDLDRDNDPDILGASSDLNTIAWWRNDGGSPIAWTEQIISNNVTLAKSVHAGDLDGDGDYDVVGAAITANDVIWWRNDGGQPIVWTEFLIDGNFIGAHRVQVVDLDDDGDEDVLGAGYLGDQVKWWRNDGGDPVEWTRFFIGGGVANACVAFATDLDGDGDKDVLATAQGINDIVWWRHDGGDPISWTKFVIADNFVRPWPLFACDLDADGDEDVIAGSSHQGSNEVKWWENRGVVSADEDVSLPGSLLAVSAYPNPFNRHTTIAFRASATGRAQGYVTLSILDLAGHQMASRLDGIYSRGIHRIVWDGRDDQGNLLAPGVYVCRLSDGSQHTERQVVFTK